MNEIEKLYKNAGVERVIPDICSNYEGDCVGDLVSTYHIW
jgi:hypothetical protein